MFLLTGTPGVNIMSKSNVSVFAMMATLVILGGYRTLQTEERLTNPQPTPTAPTSTPWCSDANGYPVSQGAWDGLTRKLRPYNPSYVQGGEWERYECVTK